MISTDKTKRYCSEPLENVENYDKAVADTKNIWHCHHRAETLPCGSYSVHELKQFGLYWNRPASELVFLPASEHQTLHRKHLSRTARINQRNARIGENNSFWGRKHSVESKKKMSLAHKGHKGGSPKGYKWFNNGVISVLAKECPCGFVRGRKIK